MGAVRGAGVRARRGLTDQAPLWRGDWQYLERSGPPELLVGEQPDPGGQRLACLCRPSAAAVVLGSTQPDDDVDLQRCAEMGYAVVRRRSGGGAVLVSPEAQLWLDLFVPVNDPLYERDVTLASHFVGALWLASLENAGETGELLEVSPDFVGSDSSRRACFVGKGSGEVMRGERKLVGLSQRRERSGAWFFSMALVRNDQPELASLLTFDSDPERRQLRGVLEKESAALSVPADAVLEELRRLLVS